MLGSLPTTLDVGGKSYKIRTDYRNILRIFAAYNDSELEDTEKVYICLYRLYVDFNSIPTELYAEAYAAALRFIECEMAHEDKPSPRTVNWEKDEQLIFPAVNKAAGMEVRSVPYLHWWTFYGYYQSIDHESLCGFVMMIRQKRARGKKLEKYEKEFYQSNTALCQLDLGPNGRPKTAEDELAVMFNSLLEEGDE